MLEKADLQGMTRRTGARRDVDCGYLQDHVYGSNLIRQDPKRS